MVFRFELKALVSKVKMSGEENDESANNFIPCMAWVRRGVAKPEPDRVQLSREELAALLKQTKVYIARLACPYSLHETNGQSFFLSRITFSIGEMLVAGYSSHFNYLRSIDYFENTRLNWLFIDGKLQELEI